MLPTLGALMAIENEVGPLQYVLAALETGRLTLDFMADVVLAGIKAAGEANDTGASARGQWSKEAVAKAMFEEGLSEELQEAVRDYIAALLWTPEQIAKKRQAEEESLTALLSGSSPASASALDG